MSGLVMYEVYRNGVMALTYSLIKELITLSVSQLKCEEWSQLSTGDLLLTVCGVYGVFKDDTDKHTDCSFQFDYYT